MPAADTGPRTYDPHAFDTSRYRPKSVDFWVPHIIRLGRITPGTRVLDVGCATGGFTQALAERTGAAVLGLDLSLDLLRYARHHRPAGVRLWCQGVAASLPLGPASFERVLYSLVLHQIPDKRPALAEASRILQTGGRVLIRTVLPELAHEWVEARYFPTYADNQRRRLTPLTEIRDLLTRTGFGDVTHAVVRRNRVRTVDEVATTIRSGSEPKLAMLSASEIDDGLARMRADLGDGEFVDARPHSFISAVSVRRV